ncbi:ABC transporter substrate-binding protein [Rhodopseudomonas palustris]|uniref:ABC transporter substrate-binding protein n=1 Tax=Rhodopseudomonas palustris TaxID=1076 RepID=A0A418V1J8_RHOPL|nr:ABC transporter substrate-binding protein [Rhodopseudomonas palustris]RJF69751.1 ABC transporter substrate-binding protein [Rhodopseudomonas palustris]
MKVWIAAIAALALLAGSAGAQDNRPYKIGVLTDMTGILSSSLGAGSVDGARMAIEDFGKTVNGRPVELVFADHQNKPDIGAGIARKWFDVDGVDVVTDIGNSAVALAVRELVQSKNKIAIYAGASSADLTGKACSPNTAQWSHDSYLFAHALPAALLRQGRKKWFLIVQDWAFGHSLESEVKKVVSASGGEIVDSVRHPPGTMDFSSFLVRAQSSGADTVAFLTAGQDLTNMIKQAHEFGLGGGGQQLVALAFLLSDAHGLGPQQAQNILFATVWYWNLDKRTREWSERFFARNKVMPAEAHAAVYSSTMHLLKAVEAAGSFDADKVMAKMRELPVNDFYTDGVKLREDGRLPRKAYVARTKTPAESREPWDYYQIVSEIEPDNAWRPLGDKACPLLK